MATDVVSPRRAATRERLCVAAMEVIAERGVLGASVEAAFATMQRGEVLRSVVVLDGGWA